MVWSAEVVSFFGAILAVFFAALIRFVSIVSPGIRAGSPKR